MNLQDFSLLKEDQNSYTIGHPKGRSFQFPKQGLSDKAQKLISGLKRVQNFDEGGDTGEDDAMGSQDSMSGDGSGEQQDVGRAPASFEADLSQDPYVIGPPQDQENPNSNAQNQDKAILEYTKPFEITGSGPPANGVAMNQDKNLPEAQPPYDQAPADKGRSPFSDTKDPFGGEEAKKSIQEGVAAQDTAGKEGAKALNSYANSVASMPTSEDIFHEYMEKDKELERAFKTKQIDPDHYWNSKGTGSKITAAIGIMLGGVGGGAGTNGRNLGLDQVNKAIDRDMEAQKMNREGAMSLWKMNREAMGSDINADIATKNMMLQGAKAKFEAAQAQAQGPIAKQQAAMAIYNLNREIAMGSWMMSRVSGGQPGSESDYLRDMQVMQMLKPDLHKDMQSKYLPNEGTTRVPVSKEDKEAFEAFHDMNESLEDAKAFQYSMKKNILGAKPTTQEKAIAESKVNNIALNLNKLNGLSRMTELEYGAFKDMISHLGAGWFNKDVAQAQIKELQNQVNQKKASKAHALGLMPFKKKQSDQQAIVWARSNPNDPRSAAILQRNGIAPQQQMIPQGQGQQPAQQIPMQPQRMP